jgi:hypothetical protein
MVSMATVSILLSAPIGAVLIKCTSDHLLHNGGKVTLAAAESKHDDELHKLQQPEIIHQLGNDKSLPETHPHL